MNPYLRKRNYDIVVGGTGSPGGGYKKSQILKLSREKNAQKFRRIVLSAKLFWEREVGPTTYLTEGKNRLKTLGDRALLLFEIETTQK